MPQDTKSPAFQYYPKDIMSDENVALMDLDAFGAYHWLMCHCWLQGSLPSDSAALRKLARCDEDHGCRPDRWPEIWPQIEPCLRSNGKGRLWHPRLKREKVKQREWREKSQQGGIASGKSRKRRQLVKGGSTKPQPAGSQMVQPNTNTPISSLLSPHSSVSTESTISGTKDNGKDECARLRQIGYLWLEGNNPELHKEALETQVLETTDPTKFKLEFRKLSGIDYFSVGGPVEP